jgi:hypothetical protein
MRFWSGKMPWIRTVPPQQANEELGEIYRSIEAACGGIAAVF